MTTLNKLRVFHCLNFGDHRLVIQEIRSDGSTASVKISLNLKQSNKQTHFEALFTLLNSVPVLMKYHQFNSLDIFLAYANVI